MIKRSFTFKSLIKPLITASLVLTLLLSHANSALAARSGGRIGGGSFGAPSRTFSSPRTYAPGGGYGGGYGYGGGGFGFPFLLPFVFGGGGGLFSLIIFFAIASFLVQTFRRVAGGADGNSLEYDNNPTVSINQVQVGLLSQARGLQTELDHLAQTADTDTPQGRAQVLQEATLSLLRHPEYWIYAGSQAQQARLEAAEAKFNQMSLVERSKFTEETLSNFNNQLRQAPTAGVLPGSNPNSELAANDPGEYIVVTLIAATLGQVKLPPINSTTDLRQALSVLGGLSSDRLLAIEILWTPQASGDTLSSDDVLVGYPNLKLV